MKQSFGVVKTSRNVLIAQKCPHYDGLKTEIGHDKDSNTSLLQSAK